jgi:cytochrome P450
MSHLIENTPKDRAGRSLLYGESRLMITAGSETTATALTFAFVFLATHPEYMHSLREEFRSNLANYHCDRPWPLLDAVITETMRLWPPVLFASPRVTPPEGLTINEHFIPGKMIVQIPPFVLHRDPRNFVHPNEFMPERWTRKPELVLDKNAYFPFLMGPYMCAGKALAQMEMRSVISRVVNEYDILMPEGFVAEEYWNGVKEHFTAGPLKQSVRFVSVGAGVVRP